MPARFIVVSSISGARLASAPLFIFLFVDRNPRLATASMVLLGIMLLTDVIDGALARRWKVTSAFGYVLDGVADRSTNIALIVALTSLGALSPLLAFLLLLRDVVLYAARSLFPTWWTTNHTFRSRVRLSALAFNILVGGLAGVVCAKKIGRGMFKLWGSDIECVLTVSLWVFCVWSYTLLVAQVLSYGRASSKLES
jgi:phosphatidylglycerophosphate synthase